MHTPLIFRVQENLFLRTGKNISVHAKGNLRAPLQNSARKEENLYAEGNLFSFGRKIIFVRKKNNLRAHTNMIESGKIVNRLITENYKIHKNDEKFTLPFPQKSMEKGKVSF